MSDLTVYSPANGKVPAAGCSWTTPGGQATAYLHCIGSSLSFDHAYIQGSLEYDGCGALSITNSVLDWEASSYWFDVYAGCTSPNSGTSVTASHSTFETSNDIVYTGKSDVGALDARGNIPIFVSNSLLKDFPQGLDPAGGSVITHNEIYARDLTCWANASAGTTTSCHNDGLFSQDGNNVTYQGNYISVPDDSTAAIFFQSDPHSTGNKVFGNFLKGGSFSLYNEDSDGLAVQNNTFGGYTYGNAALCSGSWGTWDGNVTPGGSSVNAPAKSCSF